MEEVEPMTIEQEGQEIQVVPYEKFQEVQGQHSELSTKLEQYKSNPGPVDAEGNLREGWTEDETLSKKFTSLSALEKSYKNLEHMLGTEKMPVPREDSPEDVWEQVYSKLGRPDSPDKYEIEKPEEVPDEYWNEESLNDFKGRAHKLGLTQKQVQELVKYDAERMLQGKELTEQQQQQIQAERQKELEKAWGNDYKANLELAQNAANYVDPELMNDEALGNNPKFLQALAKVGAMMSEGKIKGAKDAVTPVVDVQAEIDRILNPNGDHAYSKAYYQQSHPDHKKAVEYVNKLYKRKYPEPA